jgi:two-component sensor histidine kinase
LRTALQNLTIAVLYFLTGWIGLEFASYAGNVTLVWPPVGIALAGVILVGPRVAPGIALGLALINLVTGGTWIPYVTIVVGNILGPVLAGTLLTRHLQFRPELDRFRDVVAFAAVGVLGCSLVTASFGALSLVGIGVAPVSELPKVWALWLAGDAAGVLIVAPVALTWLSPPSMPTPMRRSVSEVGGLVAGLLAAGAVMLTYGTEIPSLAYGLFPFLVWAALRFGPRGATATTLAITTIALCGTAARVGPFVDVGSDGSPTGLQSMVSLWAFFSLTAISALLLTALLAERDQALRQRERVMHELDHRVKNTLATVLAVAQQSGAAASDVSTYVATFSERIRALARSHEALAQSRWEGLALEEVVATVLAPYGASAADRARTTEGDSTVLSAGTTGPLAMALHELATNAAKHGAWSNGHGRVEVSWSTGDDGRVRLVWREVDGPCVRPPTTRGFGLHIIDSLINYELSGDSQVDFEPTGLVCTLRFRQPTRASPAHAA